VVLSFRRARTRSGAFWRRRSSGARSRRDLEQARHHAPPPALEDTIERARHYGAMARDALAIFPKSPMKEALLETVDFCIARAH
jgi:octaprenyl-diphosphate synthase